MESLKEKKEKKKEIQRKDKVGGRRICPSWTKICVIAVRISELIVHNCAAFEPSY